MAACRVFIGSSREQVKLVEWLTAFIASNYEGRLDPVPWTIPWPGGRFTLEHLLRVVEETDASILFWTADDKTWYRDAERNEPRDNLVFEAGLFLATHGRERTQLLLPNYGAADTRKKVAVPSDVLGLIWNGFAWNDGAVEATGLPATARTVCDRLATLGPRPRWTTAVPTLVNHDRVEAARVFCGEWATISTEVIVRLAGSPNAKEIDMVAAYRVGELRRVLDSYRKRASSKLRACFSNFWDARLAEAYQRKYYDRDSAHMQDGVQDSIRGLLGPCDLKPNAAGDFIVASAVTDPPLGNYDIRLTSQRITFGYYRIDGIAVLVPLDMKRAQNPAPYAWVIDSTTAPRTFEHYRYQYEEMFGEATRVYPPS
jgi:hypothetical protein